MTHEEKTAAAHFFFAVNNQIAALWGIYIAATFAGGGFSLATSDPLSWSEATIAAIGFSAFAIGHFYLISNAIARLRGIRELLEKASADEAATPADKKDFMAGKTSFDDVVLAATHPVGQSRGSVVAHVVIDICVVALMYRHQIEPYMPVF